MFVEIVRLTLAQKWQLIPVKGAVEVMLKAKFTVIFFMFIATSAWAGKGVIHGSQANRKLSQVAEKQWLGTANTVLEIKGVRQSIKDTCKVFHVRLSEKLNIQIDCQGLSKNLVVSVEKDQRYKVSKSGAYTTLTRYGYFEKKSQVSRLEQTTMKIPYVEEIIQLKTGSRGDLALYFESFRVDEFGRIVQDKHLQAYGMGAKGLNLSSN